MVGVTACASTGSGTAEREAGRFLAHRIQVVALINRDAARLIDSPVMGSREGESAMKEVLDVELRDAGNHMTTTQSPAVRRAVVVMDTIDSIDSFLKEAI